jgi:hypothetical protein
MSNAALDNKAKVSSANSAASVGGAGYAVYDPLGQKIGRGGETVRELERRTGIRPGTDWLSRYEIRPNPGAVSRGGR